MCSRRSGIIARIFSAAALGYWRRRICSRLRGGGGLLEVDSNDNPLREDFCGAVADIKDGEIVLPETPGLGIEPDVKAIEKYRTM